MGSNGSRLGPESMVGSKREHAINFVNSKYNFLSLLIEKVFQTVHPEELWTPE